MNPPDAEQLYAEGRRVETDCRHCHQPIWIVYHGAYRNHTVEGRAVAAIREAIERLDAGEPLSALDTLRGVVS